MEKDTDKLRDACVKAAETLRKLKNSDYDDIVSKLEYVVGSYNHDHNPVGLYEFGCMALDTLINIKSKNPRKVNKKVIEDLKKHCPGT